MRTFNKGICIITIATLLINNTYGWGLSNSTNTDVGVGILQGNNDYKDFSEDNKITVDAVNVILQNTKANAVPSNLEVKSYLNSLQRVKQTGNQKTDFEANPNAGLNDSTAGNNAAQQGNIMDCLEKCANYYIACATSNKKTKSGKDIRANSGDGEYYMADGNYMVDCTDFTTILDEVRIDCTGFATFYMSVVSGKPCASGNSQTFAGNGSQTWKDAGWKRYSVSAIGGKAGLRPGDIMVFRASNHGHAEIYVGPGNETFGWGAEQSKYPSSQAAITDNGSSLTWAGNQYTVIWRYEGN